MKEFLHHVNVRYLTIMSTHRITIYKFQVVNYTFFLPQHAFY